MQEQIAIQMLLQERFADARLRNPSFSLRAFAKKAGLSPAALSEILKGKRRISPSLFAKISEKLVFTPDEINRVRQLFQESMGAKIASTSHKPNLERVQLSADRFAMIAEWYHYAILSLLETKGCKSDISWIAKRLGISQASAQTAMDRLIRLHYVAHKKQKYVLTTGYLSSTDEVVNLPLRRATGEDLHLAQKALEESAIELRDFTSVTMAVDPNKLKEAKAMIREFRTRLSTFMTSGHKEEVYKMCIQLFPLSKGDIK